MLSDDVPYLIQGFYFQDKQYLDVAYRPIEGAVTVVRSGLFRQQFAGMLWPTAIGLGQFHGAMQDSIGTSELFEVSFRDTHLSFSKRYTDVRGRDDEIYYDLTLLENGIWTGVYEGWRVGNGDVKCVVTPTIEALLRPPTEEERETVGAQLQR